jgi:hypothetical protein
MQPRRSTFQLRYQAHCKPTKENWEEKKKCVQSVYTILIAIEKKRNFNQRILGYQVALK